MGTANTRWLVPWVAEIKAMRCSPEDMSALLDAAMDLLPAQPAIVGPMGHGYQWDSRSFCFYVVVEATTSTTARALVGAGLREALRGAGIGLERATGWAPLQLELDPSALDVQAVEVA